jgi:hypothetical protein
MRMLMDIGSYCGMEGGLPFSYVEMNLDSF